MGVPLSASGLEVLEKDESFTFLLSWSLIGVNMSMAEGDTLISVDYEIFGKVQGVVTRGDSIHSITLSSAAK